MNTRSSAAAAPAGRRFSLSWRMGALVLAAGVGLSSCGAPSSQPAPSSSHSAQPSAGGSSAAASPSRSVSPSAPGSASSDSSKPSASSSASAPVKLASPDEAVRDRAAQYLQNMTLEEKAGAVIVQQFSGTDAAEAASLAQRLHLGGAILMTGNISKTPQGQVDLEALSRQVRTLRAANKDRPWGTIISIDQEGGTVARLRAPFTEWPTPLAIGATGDSAVAKQVSQGLTSELAKYGVNVNFGTEGDVTIGALDPTIGSRSYGEDPSTVAAFALANAEGSEKSGVIPVLKHFPGHGSVQGDSHLNLPVQYKSEAELAARDWVPFKKGIEAGIPMIMMGHINVPAMDAGVPSSMSPAAYEKLRSMGFQGVITTDALNMGAITESFGEDQAGLQALKAGADLLLMPVDAAKTHAAIVAAVKDGSLPQKRLDEAVKRVVQMQLFQQRLQAQRAGASEPGKGFDRSREASAKAVTILTGQCEAPLLPSRKVQLVSGSEQDQKLFKAAASKAGLTVGDEGPALSLFGYNEAPQPADIAVATDGPWNLDQAAAEAKVALYSSNPAAFEALIAVLTGKARSTGQLPTAVGQYTRGTGCGK